MTGPRITDPGGRPTDVLFVDDHQFWLLDFPREVVPQLSTMTNGLVEPSDGAALVYTGIATGNVMVTVDALAGPPEDEGLDEWDEVVDISMETTTGDLRVVAPMAERPTTLPSLSPHGPGPYRLRVHARGRDTSPDGVAHEPVELYLVLSWPGPPAPALAHKLTDTVGEQLRAPAVPDDEGPSLRDAFFASPEGARWLSEAHPHPDDQWQKQRPQ